VPIIMDKFVFAVQTLALHSGVPYMRFAFLPQPVAFQTAEICRTKILGNDPVSGVPFLEEVYDNLTQPLDENESFAGVLPEYKPPRLIGPDTPENLERLFYEKQFTDGLPIVLPTEERVAKMLKGANREPDEIIGQMACNTIYKPWKYTAEQVAVNAVMAGAKPEYFPVILAIAAIGETSLFSSTNSWARMVLVNGPIAEKIGMRGGLGAMGPWNEPNSTIGRAYTLISKNLGFAMASVTYQGTQGNNYNYNNITICENEKEFRDFWDPFHVTKGYAAEESVVSIFAGLMMRGQVSGAPTGIANALNGLRSTGPIYSAQGVYMCEPLQAKDLINIYGYQTRQEFTEWLKDHCLLTRSEFFSRYPSKRILGQQGVEPFKTWLSWPSSSEVPIPRFKYGEYGKYEIQHRPPQLDLVIVGGQANVWSYYGDFGWRHSYPIDIFLPDREPVRPLPPPQSVPTDPGGGY
jgi:hypothetical protein